MGELRGVEVFRKGLWRGNLPAPQEFTDADLEAMVGNFAALRDTLKPRLKLGHGKQILDQDTGQPALGVLETLRKDGDRLVADFADVPEELTGAINAGRYRDVSLEFFPAWEKTTAELNLKSGRTGPTVTAVALLGAELPAVSGLKELPRLYSDEDAKAVVRIDFAAVPERGTLRAGAIDDDPPAVHPRIARTMAGEPKDPKGATQEDVAALRAEFAEREQASQAERDALKTQLAAFAEQDKTRQTEIDALKARNAQAEADARKARAEQFVAKFASTNCLKLVTKGEQAAARRLHEQLAALPDQVVTFSEDGKDIERSLLADFEAMIQARPDAKGLLSAVSQATEPTQLAETLDDAIKVVAAEKKLDTSKAGWKRDATIILCSEEPYKSTYAHLAVPPGPPRTTH